MDNLLRMHFPVRLPFSLPISPASTIHTNFRTIQQYYGPTRWQLCQSWVLRFLTENKTHPTILFLCLVFRGLIGKRKPGSNQNQTSYGRSSIVQHSYPQCNTENNTKIEVDKLPPDWKVQRRVLRLSLSSSSAVESLS